MKTRTKAFGWSASRVARTATLTLALICGIDVCAPNALAAGEPTKVTVGVLPSIEAIPIYVAEAKGYFAEEGIVVSVQRFQGGPAVLQAVLAGAAQFAHAGTIPFINATNNHAPLLAIGVNSVFNAHTKTLGIFVRKDSKIKTIKDLVGHQVAINQRGNMEATIFALRTLPAEGLSASSVQTLELPYPLMQKAVVGGRVDAAIGIPPFTALMQNDDNLRLVGYLDQYIPNPGYAVTFAVVQADYAKSHPDVVKGYVAALSKGLTFARENPDAAAAIVANAFNLPLKVAASFSTYEYPPSETAVDPATWKNIVTEMKKTGAIPDSYDISPYVDIAGH